MSLFIFFGYFFILFCHFWYFINMFGCLKLYVLHDSSNSSALLNLVSLFGVFNCIFLQYIVHPFLLITHCLCALWLFIFLSKFLTIVSWLCFIVWHICGSYLREIIVSVFLFWAYLNISSHPEMFPALFLLSASVISPRWHTENLSNVHQFKNTG